MSIKFIIISPSKEFRQPPCIADLAIYKNNRTLLTLDVLNSEDLIKKDNKLIITQTPAELSVVENYFESTNSLRYTNLNTETQLTADNTAKEIERQILRNRSQRSTFTSFSIVNPAHMPKQYQNILTYLHSYFTVAGILKIAKNKTSSGLDKIPMMVLKHLTINIIKYPTIIFNNCLNHAYHTERWKKAKVSITTAVTRAGDFNARNTLWSDTITNTRGRQLDSWMCANAIKYKATLISLEKLTYPKAGSFLDHCIMDIRLHTVNLVDSKIPTLPYDSDYNAITLTIYLDKADKISFTNITASPQHYNYKKANWRKLTNYLEKNIKNQNSIPHDRNLSIYEIDQYILNLEKIITEAIKITIPKNKPGATNYYQNYVNKTIKKLHSYKSLLLTKLFRNTPYSRQDALIQRLQDRINKINQYYTNWNLKINALKSEVVFFHRPVKRINASQDKKIKEAIISVTDHNNSTLVIPQKKTVKYLGVTLDHLLRLNKHQSIQLNKAKIAIKANSRIFYNSNLEARAKIICYQLLIRPILTYAAPVLWNMGSTVMEKYQRLERSVLRFCIRTHRTAESDYKKYVSNTKIYNHANITRVNCFIIKLCRSNYANYPKINNPIINKFCCPDEDDFAAIYNSGYIPPKLFTLCDKHGLIQNENNLPFLYYIKRHCTDKTINMEPDTTTRNLFSTALPDVDKRDTHKLLKVYWWLTQDAKHIDEIRRRSLWVKQHPNQRLVS
ncbi:hypothetical protein M0802_013642 [Mischocyttarus mexicanus]|nr:hypothetical protein M0802_013642 [Mischocyttarus mexicanus]